MSKWSGGVGMPSARPESDLPALFRRHLSSLRFLADGQRVIVAVSGGVDSLVLLHLLRFGEGTPDLEVIAAHFDHGMREESGGDALWVRGVCQAWGVPFKGGVAEHPPANEDEARVARYQYLIQAKGENGARWVFTAHQADDQSETVLFRALRGTGFRGLAGIPVRRAPGIVRPLLPFSRADIETYARAAGIRPREDPSNRSLDPARNLIRRKLLPMAESGFAPGARGSLQRLARLARENEAAWDSLLPELLERISEETAGPSGGSGGPDVIARPPLLEYHPAVQARLLREWLRQRGILLGDSGTRGLLEFTRTGSSGRSFQLPGSARLVREFDEFVLKAGEETHSEQVLDIPDPGPGTGRAVVGGRSYDVVWGGGVSFGLDLEESFSVDGLRFPLRLRGWAPGDRIRLAYGSKKLKKLFSEARVPQSDRKTYPVLLDGMGRVLWVAGLARSVLALPERDRNSMNLGLSHVLDD